MLPPTSCAVLDRVLTTMFWRPGPPEDTRSADELLADLAGENTEAIAIWLQEERALPAAAAEDIADRCRR